jgi:cbb3-type cytochrome oxidase subunit 3
VEAEMPTLHPAQSSHESGPVVALALFAIVLIAVLAWAYVTGQNAQAAAELAEQNEVARENKEFCTVLGFKEQAGDYARCVSGLGEIRRKQKERWDAVIVGLM